MDKVMIYIQNGWTINNSDLYYLRNKFKYTGESTWTK
jgi:hypothetical protein